VSLIIFKLFRLVDWHLVIWKDIIRLIARFLAVARQCGHHFHIDLEGWVARPLNVSCMPWFLD
jgi:hypothetical protein